MKVLAFPKDVNPYTELLYSEMGRMGAKATYLARVTPFHSLNILLLPLETAARRLFGARLIHIHWTAPFCLPGQSRFTFVRRLSQLWFGFWLRSAARLGMRLVWTAHNVLPHDPVFADDIAARRALVMASDLVIAHSNETLAGLSEIGAVPRRVVVIPHGPFDSVQQENGTEGNFDFFRFLFIGRVKPYKGVEDLLAAFESLPAGSRSHLTVAGQCQDPALLDRLQSYAHRPNVSVLVGPERLPDAEVSRLLLEAHVVVLPFRAVTTSGSAILAISHGKPVVIPESASMIDIPDTAAIRYDGSIDGLVKALERVANMSIIELSVMSEAAFKHAHTVSWEEIAARTIAEMADILH